jgi:membrane protein insertase Oxa1/YidC/SpoIIIJ
MVMSYEVVVVQTDALSLGRRCCDSAFFSFCFLCVFFAASAWSGHVLFWCFSFGLVLQTYLTKAIKKKKERRWVVVGECSVTTRSTLSCSSMHCVTLMPSQKRNWASLLFFFPAPVRG